MGNFFFLGAQNGFDAINLDQVRHVIQDSKAGKITIYFDRDHKIELARGVATDFVDVLTRLKSEAGCNDRGDEAGKSRERCLSRTLCGEGASVPPRTAYPVWIVLVNGCDGRHSRNRLRFLSEH